jgi:nucleotidyltransferase/DNA polymerase involved in DNA repair
MKNRTYVAHFDGDSFFVSCELMRRPDLRGKPVVTGGERGVVTSMSAEARALGVKRTTPCFEIRQQFPDVIIIESSMDVYAAYAQRVYSIVREYAISVEEYSIDECFALVAEPSIALAAKRELETATGLTFGVGVATTKTLAKVASRLSKPAGYKELLDQSEIDSVLTHLPVESVWGIGRATSVALRARGIGTAAELVASPRLDSRFSEPVRRTARELGGRMEIQIVESAPARFFEGYTERESPQDSVRCSRTFHPAESDIESLRARAVEHLDDKNLETVSVEVRIEPAAATPMGCLPALRRALASVLVPGVLYKTVGVTLYDFVDRGVVQEDLFSGGAIAESVAKREAVADAIDALRHRLGEGIIRFGAAASKRDDTVYKSPIMRHAPVRPWAYPYLGEVT